MLEHTTEGGTTHVESRFCWICGKAFEMRGMLADHLGKMHSQETDNDPATTMWFETMQCLR
jgi:hypothetical protein